MNNMDADDMAVEALRKVMIDAQYLRYEDLIMNLYRLQKLHQFDHERSVSMQEMERAIERCVDEISPGGLK